MAKDPPEEVSFLYNVGEKAFAMYADTKWYPVVIRDRNGDKHPDSGGKAATYLVHYNGWNERFDEWMLEECLMKSDIDGERQAKEENDKVQATVKHGTHQKSTQKKLRTRLKMVSKAGDDASPALSRAASVVSGTSDSVDTSNKLGVLDKRLGGDNNVAGKTAAKRPGKTLAAGSKKSSLAAGVSLLGVAQASGDANVLSPSSTATHTTLDEDDTSSTFMFPPSTSGGGTSSTGGKDERVVSLNEGSTVSSIVAPLAGTSVRRGSARRAAAVLVQQQNQQQAAVVDQTQSVKSPPSTPLTATASGDVSLASPATSISAGADVKSEQDITPAFPATPQVAPKSLRKGRAQQLAGTGVSSATASPLATPVPVLGGKSTTSSGSAASSVSGTLTKQQQQLNRHASQRRSSTATTPLTSPPALSPRTTAVNDGSLIDPSNESIKKVAKHYFQLARDAYMRPEPMENAWLVIQSLPHVFSAMHPERSKKYLSEWRTRRIAYLDALKDYKQYLLRVPESVKEMMVQDYSRIVHQQLVWSTPVVDDDETNRFDMQAIFDDYQEHIIATHNPADPARVDYHDLALAMAQDLQVEARRMCALLYSHRKMSNDTNDEEHSIFIVHEVAHMTRLISRKKPAWDLTFLGAPHVVRLLHQMEHALNVLTDVRGETGKYVDMQFEHLQAVMTYLDTSGIARDVVSKGDQLYSKAPKTSSDKTDTKVKELFHHADQLPISAVYENVTEHWTLKGFFFMHTDLLVDVDEHDLAEIMTCFDLKDADAIKVYEHDDDADEKFDGDAALADGDMLQVAPLQSNGEESKS